MAKETITIYPEFGPDPRHWVNLTAPPIDQRLVRDLEGIARTPDGRPRYRVVYAPDQYLDIDDTPEYTDLGAQNGVEKGFRAHQYSLCVFQVLVGFEFMQKGERKYLPTAKAALLPAGAVVNEVFETRSISVPRYIVEEFLDRTIHPVFGDGDYHSLWAIEDRREGKETENAIEVISTRREFTYSDVVRARAIYNHRLNTTRDEINAALRGQAEKKEKAKLEAKEQESAEYDEMIDRFIKDKAYMPKSDPATMIIHRGEKIQ